MPRPRAFNWGLAAVVLVVIGSFGLVFIPGQFYGINAPMQGNPSAAVQSAATAPNAETRGTSSGDYQDRMLDEAYATGRFSFIEQSGLNQQVSLSQSVNGYTVTIKRVYADPNEIVIGYIIEGPEGSGRLNARIRQVRDSSGASHGLTFGVHGPPQGGTSAHVSSFYGGQDGKMPSTLNLNIELDVYGALGPPPPVQGSDGQLIYPTPTTIRALQSIAGPFKFDFSVPVHSTDTHVIEANQTSEASGVSTTLERLIVTQGMTQAIVKLAPKTQEVASWQRATAYMSEGWDNPAQNLTYGPDVMGHLDAERRFLLLQDNMHGKSGQWTLTISELVSGEDDIEQAMQLQGPWIFKVTLPTAGQR